MFYSKKGCSKARKDVLKQERMFWNGIGHSEIVFFKTTSSIFCLFCSKKCAKVQWHIACLKMSRTHIPHTFQNGFCTHTHDRTLHVCVHARTFATHTLIFFHILLWIIFNLSWTLLPFLTPKLSHLLDLEQIWQILSIPWS